MTQVFYHKLDEVEERRAEKWAKSHECKKSLFDVFSKKKRIISIACFGNSVAVKVHICCSCGDWEEITNYDCW